MALSNHKKNFLRIHYKINPVMINAGSPQISQNIKMKSFSLLLMSVLAGCVTAKHDGYEEPPYTTVNKSKVGTDNPHPVF